MPQAAVLAVMAVASVAGTAVAVHGQRQQAKAAEAAAEFNAKVAQNEAKRIELENKEQLARNRILQKRLLGKQRATIGKAGVLETGSPLDLMVETAAELELGLLDQNREALARAQQMRNKSALTLFEGKSTASGLRTQSVATGIGGVANIGGSVARFTKKEK